MSTQPIRALALVSLAAALALIAAVGSYATPTLGTVFPGFAVTAVTESISAASWLEIAPLGLAEREILRVNDLPANSTGRIFDLVEGADPAKAIRYTTQHPDGTIGNESITPRPFTALDFASHFGIYLITGLSFFLVGTVSLWRQPRDPKGLAIYSAGLTFGVFYLTSADNFAADWVRRLHTFASLMIPASIVHLGLALPVERIRRDSISSLWPPYLPCLAMALFEDLAFRHYPEPSLLRELVGPLHAAAMVYLLGVCMYDYLTSASRNVHQRIASVVIGSAAIVLLPLAVTYLTGFEPGGRGITVFLVPLYLAYVMAENESFEIDQALRRFTSLVAFAATVGTVSAVVTGLPPRYGGALSAIPTPATVALLMAAALTLFATLRLLLHRSLDRRFAVDDFDRDKALTELSGRLARAYGRQQAIEETEALIGEVLAPAGITTFLDGDDGRLWPHSSSGSDQRRELVLPDPERQRLDRGEVLSLYETEGLANSPTPAFWRQLEADLLLPLRGGPSLGVLAVRRRPSGRRYDENDIGFLRAAGNQLALALTKTAMLDQMENDAAISSALIRVQNEIACSLNSPDVLQRVCQATAEALELECSHTLLWEREGESFVTIAAYGDPSDIDPGLDTIEIPPPLLESLKERLRSEEAILTRTDQLRYSLLAEHFGYLPSTMVIMPLRRDGQIIGLHLAGNRSGTPTLQRRHFRIARGIGQVASMAMANACLMEELAGMSRVKSEFVASMSHELRTPLHHIIGYNDLLIDGAFGEISEEQNDTLKRVRRSSHNLLDLIEATLNLSRLDANKVDLEESDIDLRELVAVLSDRLGYSCNKPGVHVEWKVHQRVGRLRTDRVKLEMILKNLVENAVKFTERGRVVVTLRENASGISFEVTDSGKGIPADRLGAIFDPFRKIHDPAASRGVGLGLHIVRRLVDLLEGTITVESEVGLGSRFEIWLPFDRSASMSSPVAATPETRARVAAAPFSSSVGNAMANADASPQTIGAARLSLINTS